MAADMREATCAGTKTSKVPTEVRSLFNTSSVVWHRVQLRALASVDALICIDAFANLL